MKTVFVKQLSMWTVAATAVFLLGGCATSGNVRDPIEGFNRVMFAFNDGIDKVIIKPVAQGYEAALPPPLRTGVSNFFGNIDDIFIAANNLLQGKVPEALSDVGRVLINSTVGILGVIDVASDAGLEKHDEDFGQTFGRWGVGDGAYLVLPLFGPHTLRDTFGLILDVKTDPVAQLNTVSSRNTLTATRGISERARLLSTDKIVEEAALDRYSYIRDAYLQRRRSKIFDGNPPREKYYETSNAAETLTAWNQVATTLPAEIGGVSNQVAERDENALVPPATLTQRGAESEPRIDPTPIQAATSMTVVRQ